MSLRGNIRLERRSSGLEKNIFLMHFPNGRSERLELSDDVAEHIVARNRYTLTGLERKAK